MPIVVARASVFYLTLSLLHGTIGGHPGSDDLVWYMASGKSGKTDGANALYEATRRPFARTPNT